MFNELYGEYKGGNYHICKAIGYCDMIKPYGHQANERGITKVY